MEDTRILKCTTEFITRTKLCYNVRNYSLVLQIFFYDNDILFLECKDDPSSVGSNYYDIIKNIKNILTGKANWGDYDFPNVNKPDNDGYPEPPNDNAENSDVKDKNNDNFQDLPGENSSANKSESDYDDDYDEYPDKVTTKKPKTSTRPTTTRKPKGNWATIINLIW